MNFFFVLPRLPSNEKNSPNHHNSYNNGPNLVLFSFMESPSNSLSTIKFPKNHITSSYHRNLPKIENAIFVRQRAVGIKWKVHQNLKHKLPKKILLDCQNNWPSIFWRNNLLIFHLLEKREWKPSLATTFWLSWIWRLTTIHS